MKQAEPSKIVFLAVAAATIIGGAFLVGMYSGVTENVFYRIVKKVRDDVALTLDEAPTLTGTRPEGHLQPAKYEGSGVTINRANDQSLVLLSGFFGDSTGLKLVRRDGSVVAEWPVQFSRLFPQIDHIMEQPPATDWNTDIHGALMLPDGSVVFNFEYMGLVRLGRCGETVWALNEPTHHSVETSESGGFWTTGRYRVDGDEESPYPPFNPPFYVDTVMKVSESGEVLNEFSVLDLFYENDLATLLTATGGSFNQTTRDSEIVHVNKIGELASDIADDFELFSAGDLVLSIRESNLVMVFDPETRKVRWWRIGPWIRQHDPEFKAGGTITVFNNNLYRKALGQEGGYDLSLPTIPRISNIIEIDPVTDRYEVILGEGVGENFLSVIRGKHQLTADGGILVTEFEGGRAFEVNADREIIWEFINRYDENTVAEITEARVYPEQYFSVTDWSCPSSAAQ